MQSERENDLLAEVKHTIADFKARGIHLIPHRLDGGFVCSVTFTSYDYDGFKSQPPQKDPYAAILRAAEMIRKKYPALPPANLAPRLEPEC